jgi:endonuclease IV
MFGVHISKHAITGDFVDIADAIDAVVSKYDLSACQIFTHGPKSRSKNKYDATAIRALDKANIYVHSTYLTDGYWGAVESAIARGGRPNITPAIKQYHKHIQDQLDATKEIGGVGLVIHVTRKPITIIKKGADLLAAAIDQPSSVVLIFEFTAMRPGEDSYESVKQINALADALRSCKLNWKFCIDTSHLWATGLDVSNITIFTKWLHGLKCANRIALIHLNASSKSTFGTGKDVHIVPFAPEDDIWGSKLSSHKFSQLTAGDFANIEKSTLGLLLRWAKKNKITVLGEFKRGTTHQLDFAIAVVKHLLRR